MKTENQITELQEKAQNYLSYFEEKKRDNGETREYRKKQIEKLQLENAKYAPSIQLVSDMGKTFYMDINEEEIKSIIKILVGK